MRSTQAICYVCNAGIMRIRQTIAHEFDGERFLVRRRVCDICGSDTKTMEFLSASAEWRYFEKKMKEGKNAKT